ncbi:WD40 repeat domain-containing protein [Chloropicon primus]|uniref:WD40 repeat domain-containing protein n=1 Tax=Chloropicon primus TaxID=1764295 RepID=A0A5B8MCA6_9CHLO|nr:WD40 repeat domain-containing protein [Chloropicon primus]UPQ97310.1 WD40 repeat domain-containing protein [Chloropicon primus]|eukprot:QDZ18097.1 WD40 repeat domain-containing protein [Chloropicon primus]
MGSNGKAEALERKENSWLASTSAEKGDTGREVRPALVVDKENRGTGFRGVQMAPQLASAGEEGQPRRLSLPVDAGPAGDAEPETMRNETEQSFLSVSVNHVDTLVPRKDLSSPIVRVSVLDAETGQYLGFMSSFDISNFERKGKQKTMRLLKERVPPNVIPPAQTGQCILKNLPFPKLAATWNASATFPQDVEVLQQQNSLIVFEILQPVLTTLDNGGILCFSKRPKQEIPIAWAFLKLKSADETLNLGHLRLQLYEYKGRTSNACSPQGEQPVCKAFEYWNRKNRQKYNATMYVSLEKVTQKKLVETPRLLRQVSRVLGFSKKESESETGSDANGELPILFDLPARKAHELCKIPNSLGQYLADSARGTTYVAFANQGKFIAVACADLSLYSVRIFNLQTLSEEAVLTVHHDTIYEISWSSNDKYLVTASSDHTAKVWAPFDGVGSDGHCQPVSTLQHLTFVYTAKFHPAMGTESHLVVTGAFDHGIRVWDALSGELLQTVHGFKSHINTVAFDVYGKYLYAGDGKGVIKEFLFNTREGNSSCLKFIRVNKDLEGEPISCIQTLSSKRKLLVLTKRSNLCSIDLGVFTVGRQYHGIKCLRTHIQFAVSPDERYIISGSEDGRTFMWNIEHGQVVQLQHIVNAGNPITCISWSPYEHVIAVSTFKPEHPVMIFVWDDSKEEVKEARMLEDQAHGTQPKLVQTPRRLKHMSQVERDRDRDRANILADLPTELTPDQVSNIISGIKSRMAESYKRDYLGGD